MGDWYEIGITSGIGVAAGIAFAGVLAGLRFGFATTLLGAIVVGVVAGLLVNGWIGAAGGVVGAVIGAVSAAAVVRGAGRRGATVGGTAFLLVGAAVVVGLLALDPRRSGTSRRSCSRSSPRARAPERPREVRRASLAREVSAAPVILVVIDGLTPSMLEGAIGSGDTPTLAALAAAATYGRATSVFPSLTPVCLSSIATGAHGDIHEIPHLVWFDRGEQRVVEYGSSFGAVRAAGIGQTLRDTLVNMNAAAPRQTGGDHVRVARRRRPAHCRRQLHRLPRPNAAPLVGAVSRRRLAGRSASSSTTSSAPTARARRSRGATGRRARSTRTRLRSAAGS